MKIPPEDFRWYAAFHDEGNHPHVHMMAWSVNPKCIGVLRLTVFRDFGAFPLGILREVRPILSIVFVRSFPRVGLGVGQTDTSASKKPRMGFAVIFRLAVSLS